MKRIALVLCALFLAACGESVLDLTEGQCIQLPEGESQVAAVETIDCEEPHDAEVFSVFELEEGDFPGPDEVRAQAQEGCLEEFEGYVGAAFEESSLEFSALTPNEDGWGRGDREIVCYLRDPAGQLEGSMQDSGA